MIFEMTRDYSIIVPLMVSNLVSYYVSYKLQPQPIYEALAHQQGVVLPGAEPREHFTLLVSDIIREDHPIQADASLVSIAGQLKDSARNAWPVVNAHGHRTHDTFANPGRDQCRFGRRCRPAPILIRLRLPGSTVEHLPLKKWANRNRRSPGRQPCGYPDAPRRCNAC
jgi:hypothetical protein